MTLDRQKSIAAMRTFARDLERERGHDASQNSDKTTPTKQDEPVIIEDNSSHKLASIKISSHEAKHKDEPDRIPAFHELKKEKVKAVQENIKAEPKKKEKIKNKKGITTDTPKGGGTIITDTKKERRPFFKEVATSLSAWLANFKKEFKKKQKKTYVVTETTRRKGVVQKATTKTGTIFSADNETLMNEIRKRQRAEKSQADDGKEEVLWSPYTESGYALLDGEVEKEKEIPKPIETIKPAPTIPKPQVQNVVVQAKKRSLPEPVTTKPTNEAPPIVDEEVIKALESEPVAEEVREPEPVYEEIIQTEPEIQIEEPAQKPEPEYIEPFINGPWWLPSSYFHHNTNKLTMVVFAVISVATVGVIASISVFGTIAIETPIDQPELRKSISADGVNLQSVTLSNASYNDLSTKLNTAILSSNTSDIVEFEFVNEQAIPVSPLALSAIIDMREGDVFAQTLVEMRALKLSNNSRAVVFEVDDNINARGGLLDWELFMYEDTALLLDTKYGEEIEASFYDLTFGNHDVRVLKNGDDVLLVYGFIDSKKIVITSSLDAFIAITEL